MGSGEAVDAWRDSGAGDGTWSGEAGESAKGSRRVGMGLAGGRVVRASDGSAYGTAGAGDPSTAYNDDAVVVRSEIDTGRDSGTPTALRGTKDSSSRRPDRPTPIAVDGAGAIGSLTEGSDRTEKQSKPVRR